MNICLIGHGYWGSNLLRTMVETDAIGRVFLFDLSAAHVESALGKYPQVIALNSFDEVVSNPEIEAVVCATPSSTHHPMVRQLLEAGKHVLVEKPFVLNEAHAMELIALAEQRNLTLMVDHIFMYNPAVQQLKTYITPEFVGRVNYIDATRINLGIYQHDTNVLWDLACHDLSIILHLIDEQPISVRAIGRVNPDHGAEDLTYLFLSYASGLLVHINSSWASPVKIRKMIIGGEKRMIIYDDIEPTNKLVIYDYDLRQKAEENGNKVRLTDYRLGDITIPKHALREPLKNVMDEFVSSVRTGKRPLSDGRNALRVVRILEKAQESLAQGGAVIPLA